MYGWIEDPEPVVWPTGLPFSYGEVVSVVGIESLEGRIAVVSGFRSADDQGLQFYVHVEGDDISWVLGERNMLSTGVTDTARLPRAYRPVLGDGTVVRMLDTPSTREHGLVGTIALTAGLWYGETSGEPCGYVIRVPGERACVFLPFGVLEVVAGHY